MERSAPSKVLLLSADEELSHRVRSRLEGAYEVVACSDGREGVRLVQDGGIDLVLYDAALALEEGVLAASLIRTEHPFLPMIPVTSILRDEDPDGPRLPYSPPDRTGSGGAPADAPL